MTVVEEVGTRLCVVPAIKVAVGRDDVPVAVGSLQPLFVGTAPVLETGGY